MDVELIAVGSELLGQGFIDSNSPWIADWLARLGLDVRRISVVGDEEEPIAEVVRGALGSPGAVIVTGGLGPTGDDRTRAGLARALGLPLERDPVVAAALLRRRGSRRGPDPTFLQQADRPRGAGWIDNPVGTAPGIAVARDDRWLFALPGVPAEMRAMFEASVAPVLGPRGRPCARCTLKVAGRSESSVDARIRDLYGSSGTRVTILARPTEVEIRLTVRGDTSEEAAARLRDLEAVVASRLGADLYGRDEDTLAAVVGRGLRAAGSTVATAESCTAGMLAAALTEPPGASAWFRGGLVAYADDLKTSLARVAGATLAEAGAVSAEVAAELAEAARARCGADYGLGVTGIAGPGGGTVHKPVGVVHLAVASRSGVAPFRFEFRGDRDLVRRMAVGAALDRLRRAIREPS